MSRRQVDATGDTDTLILAGCGVGLAVLTVGGIWVAEHLSASLTGRPAPAGDPLRLFVHVLTGRTAWPLSASVVAGVLAVVLAAIVTAVVMLWPQRMRTDRAARHLARGRDLDHLQLAGATRKAVRLAGAQVGPGLPIGRTVPGGKPLFSSWEDMVILIAGPRTQKTTSYAVPAILAAPGAVLATSNKRDLLDVTSAARAERGAVWTFDPQHVANAIRSWWWNPLSYIDGDETRAERLAAQFATSSRPAGTQLSAYWDAEAESLIALLLLAAAVGARPITRVYSWLTRPTSPEPADLLKQNDYRLQYESLVALSDLPDKQRQGVYGTARSLVGFLRSRDVQQWVTPGEGREFNPVHFAQSTDTLYALSKEGDASVAPLVAGLTMVILEALEDAAAASPAGRLPVPFVGVLDEAANVCRLRNLDGYYSHYGSRGIVLLTILQSWAQGAEAWTDKGIEKLWSAANVRIYGGGVDDNAFLRRLSELIGPHELVRRSSSYQRGRRTITRNIQERVILTPAELRELPAGRAVVFPSGTPATLVQPVPWFRDKALTAVVEVKP